MDKSVLIVDDEPMMRQVLSDFFAEVGFLVFEAGDGPQALEVLKNEHPSLVLLDLHLTKMTGFEVLKKAKQISPKSLVVVLTGVQDEKSAKEAIGLGAYDYLTKPISLEKLQTELLNRIFVE